MSRANPKRWRTVAEEEDVWGEVEWVVMADRAKVKWVAVAVDRDEVKVVVDREEVVVDRDEVEVVVDRRGEVEVVVDRRREVEVEVVVDRGEVEWLMVVESDRRLVLEPVRRKQAKTRPKMGEEASWCVFV
ncbi:hypothetical protein ACLB2K_034625 [Fragaria x ananassa]